MSFGNENAVMTMPVAPTGYGNGGGMFGGDWSAWIILFLIWAAWGGNGWGNGNGAGNGVGSNYVLATDFANIERKIDGVNNGLCQNGYNAAQLANGIQMQVANEGRGIDNAVCNLGYNTQLGFNTLGAQLADCCCKTQTAIGDAKTQSVFNTNAIQQQIAQCCCENEKMQLQGRYDAAQAHCATLQAIDKVGDRIIDYMTCEKTQALRDENQALRLAASQAAQNQYLVGQLRPPFPIPAYTVANPFAPVTGAAAA